MSSKTLKASLFDENILITIVSFLPFKEAAKTSVLTKKWSDVWRSTRNIVFDERFFVDPLASDETKARQRKFFFFFANDFMESYKRGNRVDKFTLKVSNPEMCAYFVETCVKFATDRGVKELRLDFSDPTWEDLDDDDYDNNDNDNKSYDEFFQLPDFVYRHVSLEALELHACSFSLPDLCKLVALKELSLGWIGVSLKTVKTFLSTLEKLQTLCLRKCWNLEHFDLASHRVGLTKLVIDQCHFRISDYVDLEAPNLRFLKYSGKLGIFQVKALPINVQEAQLDFTSMPGFEEYGDDLCDLLHDLRHVRVLTVCSFLLQSIHTGEEPNPMKHDMNVRHLIVKTELHNYELYGLVLLLTSCKRLEKLTLELGQGRVFLDCVKPYPFDIKTFCDDHDRVFECLKKTLRMVEVKQFRGTKNAMYMCFYLIQACRVLELLVIHVMKEEGDPMVAHRYERARYLKYNIPKGSSWLEIVIV